MSGPAGPEAARGEEGLGRIAGGRARPENIGGMIEGGKGAKGGRGGRKGGGIEGGNIGGKGRGGGNGGGTETVSVSRKALPNNGRGS